MTVHCYWCRHETPGCSAPAEFCGACKSLTHYGRVKRERDEAREEIASLQRTIEVWQEKVAEARDMARRYGINLMRQYEKHREYSYAKMLLKDDVDYEWLNIEGLTAEERAERAALRRAWDDATADIVAKARREKTENA